MKLLLDENLSRRLLGRLMDLFPGSRHVELWTCFILWTCGFGNMLRRMDFESSRLMPIFCELATAMGPPPKVILLHGCDYSTAEAERILRSQAIRIIEFLETTDRAVLVLKRWDLAR